MRHQKSLNTSSDLTEIFCFVAKDLVLRYEFELSKLRARYKMYENLYDDEDNINEQYLENYILDSDVDNTLLKQLESIEEKNEEVNNAIKNCYIAEIIEFFLEEKDIDKLERFATVR